MLVKTTLNVTILTSATAMTLKPGDEVMVHGDVIIGKYAPPTTLAELTARPPDPTEAHVMTMLQNGPKNVREISDALGLARSDSQTRQFVGNLVQKLAKKNQIKALNPTDRYKIYTLT